MSFNRPNIQIMVIHFMGYYSMMKRNELLNRGKMWMNLKYTLLLESGQSEKTKTI
jgi:hypothetical protein